VRFENSIAHEEPRLFVSPYTIYTNQYGFAVVINES
jgi:hypothetical protein